MKLQIKHGINLFDNAETYGDSLAEKNMGFAIRQGITDGAWSREDLVITTKNRKHIAEGSKGSLKRLQLDYVDVIFCLQPDPYTPIEETVRAMNFVIEEVGQACEIVDRLGLIRLPVEQPEYSLLERTRVEHEYVDLY
eukprot:jgi/Phyca11/11032/fgenesh1_pm.PHYCAscaffold_60_\